MTQIRTWLTAYLILINLYTWMMFGIDKWKALNGRWRIPEKVLLGTAVAGGSLGAFIAMKLFHHKTRKKRFSVVVPLMLVLHIALLAALFWYGLI